MAGTYTQSRALPHFGPPVSTLKRWKISGVLIQKQDRTFNCSQVTTSFRSGLGESLVSASELRESNNFLNNLRQTQGVKYDTGHSFTTVKKVARVNIPIVHYEQPTGSYVYDVPFTHTLLYNVVASSYPSIPRWDTANSDGNKAIAATYPTKPEVSLAQTMVELKREGLPSLFGSQIASMKGSAARAIGGEFLNSVFGWTPLISDLDKLLKSVVSSSKTIQQMRRDSGKIVRRKHHFPTTTEVIRSSSVAASAVRYDSGVPTVNGTLTTEETRVTSIWFSGAYTYFLDPGDDLVGKAIMYEQLANKLLGLRITPATLWELAPWSWLSDWYVNIGENLTVGSAFQQDGLVLKYGYLMRKVTASTLYTFTPLPVHLAQGFEASQIVLQTTSKERIKSSPFGFGVSTTSFTARQWAILGALGLTKAPRSLR